ncbi:MAG TPA: type III-B CRISPR module RAMP protein Cmr4 [Pirellulales bacterium]|nr:type III-B CRISPR module RAMP protein Cmr4 [Pirellulales bacterium]
MTSAEGPQRTAVLFLHAQTALHPGSGTALGVVDLPVQRERHTQWPLVPGSALKGILRDRCRERAKVNHGGSRKKANEDDAELVAAFGPATADADKHAGALAVTDARILAFPVRSLKGVFAWVTCPAVVGRLGRDLVLAHQAAAPPILNVPESNTAICPEHSPLLLDGKQLVLEEFDFTCVADSGPLAAWVADHAAHDEFTRDRLRKHLVVLRDDDFTHFVRHATEVVARIGLDYDKKTVKTGALFYQEFLPAETLFYALVFANDSRRDGGLLRAADILGYLRGHVPDGSVLQVGGDETIGKGLCTVRLDCGKEGGE